MQKKYLEFPKIFFFLIFLNKDSFYPGETVAVKTRGTPAGAETKCIFQKKEYPVFFTEENTARVLIGLSGNLGTGEYVLSIQSGEEKEERIIKIKEKIFPEERVAFSPGKMKLLTLPENEKQRELILRTLKTCSEKQNWQGKFIPPAPGKISSPYGVRRSTENFHKGVDISTPIYTSVFSPNAGIVILATQLNLQGNTVIIDHGQSVMTVYYHLSSLVVKPGQLVKKGGKIGEVGDSGLTTAPHLHWGLYIHSEAVDPLVWLNEEF